eukprot:GAHX01000028.1.p1 GENE.GAHX01000028.1~~GAHX01000028.1.p1  ORF type:complete len:226 (-),score=77.86 GAHX01000028.1:638-1315(-)
MNTYRSMRTIFLFLVISMQISDVVSPKGKRWYDKLMFWKKSDNDLESPDSNTDEPKVENNDGNDTDVKHDGADDGKPLTELSKKEVQQDADDDNGDETDKDDEESKEETDEESKEETTEETTQNKDDDREENKEDGEDVKTDEDSEEKDKSTDQSKPDNEKKEVEDKEESGSDKGDKNKIVLGVIAVVAIIIVGGIGYAIMNMKKDNKIKGEVRNSVTVWKVGEA